MLRLLGDLQERGLFDLTLSLNGYFESRTLSQLALDTNGPSHLTNDLFANGQPKAGALPIPTTILI